MATGDISLTSGMRSSLLSLQGLQESMTRSQKRLATGRKVNSALDNPTNFFASQTHMNRASDLNNRKDGIREAIQIVFAANNGISAISTLLETSKGIGNAALGTNDQESRKTLSLQFDEILRQIDTVASDSVYRGTNLLNNDSLTVSLSEKTGESSLNITAADATHAGLNVDLANPEVMTPYMLSQKISAGTNYGLSINSDGTVNAWGDGASTTPADLTDVQAVKSGNNYSLALKDDGTVVAWGTNSSGVIAGAAGLTDITAIAAGNDFAAALKSDGTVITWGAAGAPPITDMPAGLSGVTSIAAGLGSQNVLALKDDGSVVAWGSDDYEMITQVEALNTVGSFTPPFGGITVTGGLTDITAIASGGFQAAALRSDGTVVAFGSDNAHDQLAVPAGLTGVTSLAAGPDFTLALKSDGTVVGWGTNSSGQLDIPADLKGVLAISAGSGYALALKNDGSVVGWGSNSDGMLAPQTGMDVGNAWATTDGIQNSMDQVDSAVSTMRSTAKSLSSNSSVLTTRLDFTNSMMNILQTGADNLTLADMNDEGASMLMLQTRQQIAVTSLSMASQASQSVMRLF